ncbi:MAG: hypothetical protein U1E50_03205 [Caulobacteraceae bacterium]
MTAVSIGEIAARLAAKARAGEALIVGLTGSVAAGKSTLAASLVEELERDRRVETIATDGFLMPNDRLTELGILNRKGFPESYDGEAMGRAIAGVRAGVAEFPGYSHMIYDIDPSLSRRIEKPDVLILEGLGLTPLPSGFDAAEHLDLLIYLDANEADLERWFLDRFMVFWEAGKTDAGSFYHRFREMSPEQARGFGLSVWQGINLPNLREHIVRARQTAGLVVKKGPDHALSLVREI